MKNVSTGSLVQIIEGLLGRIMNRKLWLIMYLNIYKCKRNYEEIPLYHINLEVNKHSKIISIPEKWSTLQETSDLLQHLTPQKEPAATPKTLCRLSSFENTKSHMEDFHSNKFIPSFEKRSEDRNIPVRWINLETVSRTLITQVDHGAIN